MSSSWARSGSSRMITRKRGRAWCTGKAGGDTVLCAKRVRGCTI
eukprot:gene14270-biopygen20094